VKWRVGVYGKGISRKGSKQWGGECVIPLALVALGGARMTLAGRFPHAPKGERSIGGGGKGGKGFEKACDTAMP